jgi:hypothetical protein
MLYVAIWYVSIRPVVMRVKEERRATLKKKTGTKYHLSKVHCDTAFKLYKQTN